MNNGTDRATAGFIVSLIAGFLMLIGAVLFVFLAGFIELLGGVLPSFITDLFTGLAAIGVIFAILVIIGAILIYIPGYVTIGSILVIIFSILSIITGGGFFIGLILGIIGGILGLARK